MQTQALNRDLTLYYMVRFFGTVGIHMVALTNAWQVYELTNSPTSLGLIGLFQFLPIFLLCLPAGQAADRFEKQKIVLLSYIVFSAGALVSVYLNYNNLQSVQAIYAVVVILGVARAFVAPAIHSFFPNLVPAEKLSAGIAFNTAVWQVASIMGPMLAGIFVAWLKVYYLVYIACAVFLLIATLSAFCIRTRAGSRNISLFNFKVLFEGVHYVRQNKLLLGSMSLDLFAVLLGGATALMPIFAKDILNAGPTALGLLRSSPGLGAALMGIYLAKSPILKNAGPKLFKAVFIFGILTVGFGLSRNIVLSVLILMTMGAADLISIIIRQSLVQLRTPEHMRGRVSAVSQVFIGASNELGEIESGFTAAWFGTIRAVLLGGLGTCAIAIVWQKLFPSLKTLDELHEPKEVA